MYTFQRWALAVALCAFLSSFTPRPARACMPGVWHPRQDAVLLWNDGVEVLVWRTLVDRDPPGGQASEGRPQRPKPEIPLAWLIAVPSTPIAYQVVDVADFEGTLNWSRSYVRASSSVRGGDGEGRTGGGIGGLEVGPRQQIGEYEVTPIRGRGADAGRALSAWLRQNRFPQVNARAVRRYIAENATFVAVKARLPRDTSRAELRPLAIAFRSDSIVLPVRLSAGETPFALGGVVFSSKVPYARGELGHGMTVQRVHPAGRILTSEEGNASVIAHVSVAAVMRRMIGRIAARVPEMRRLEHGSLAFMAFDASPLAAELNRPDPTFALGASVPSSAPSAIAPAQVVNR